MLVVEVNAKQPIERALKVLKRKWDKSKAMKILRDKKEFTKKSVKRRSEIGRAKYVQKKYRTND
jgi:small subunit ribosomal protein S21